MDTKVVVALAAAIALAVIAYTALSPAPNTVTPDAAPTPPPATDTTPSSPPPATP